MTKITVHSRVCDHTHVISGERKGKMIHIDIDSSCENVRRLAHIEVPFREILHVKDNFVLERAQEAHCSGNCLVPCGILNVCWIEAGMLSSTLCKKAGSVEIEFH